MALENCTLCRGTGWKLVPRADGAAGKVAVPCDCGMQERAGRVMERALIPKRYEHCDFESYSTDVGSTQQQRQSLQQAKLSAQGFVRDYPGSSEKGVLFIGPSGVGKTHLAVAALKELIQRGHAGLFCDYRELLKEIQASYNPASESTEMRILEPIRTVEVLVLDDLGAQKPNEWVWDTVALILNTRYNDKQSTIITTNYPDLPAGGGGQTDAERAAREQTLGDRIGDRMRSRLAEMCVRVEMEGKDFRQAVQRARFG